jgi:hypothetical protein
MSEKRMFKVGYIEYPQSVLIYESLDIDVSNYPELAGMTDDEISDYIKENSSEMKPTNDFYDSLHDELMDQDIVREKIPRVDSEVWAEPTDEEDNNEEDNNDDYED